MFLTIPRPSGRATTLARNRARRFSLEALEARALLSLGSEFAVNTITRGAQYESDNASAPDGTSVIVRTDAVSPTNHDIRARLYDGSGAALGPDFAIDDSANDDTQPAVSMTQNGYFVVVWTRTASNGNRSVEARTFNPSGTPRISTLDVTSAGFDADVAMDRDGNFVVVWTFVNFNSDQDIDYSRYDIMGQPFRLAEPVALSSQPETHPSVASAADGRFAIAYEVATTRGDHDIKLVQITSDGTHVTRTTVAGTTSDETSPSVSANDVANAVVAWQDHSVLTIQPIVGGSSSFRIDEYSIRARRVFRPALAQPLGNVITIASSLGGKVHYTHPTVAVRRDGGDNPGAYVVAYNTSGGLSFTDGIGVTEISPNDTIRASFAISAQTADPALSIDQVGDYVLSYTRYDSTPNSLNTDPNIRKRRGVL